MPKSSLPPIVSGGRFGVGHLLELASHSGELIARGQREHGDSFSLRVPGYRHAVVMVSESGADRVLRETTLSTEASYPFLRDLFAEDFFLSAAPQRYQEHKSLLTPVFAGKAYTRYLEVMNEEAAALVAGLGERGTMVLTDTVGSTVLRIAARCFVGDDLIDRIGGSLFTEFRQFSRGLVYTPRWLPSPGRIASQRAKKRLKHHLTALMQDRRRTHTDLDGTDFLSMMATARHADGTPVTDDEIQAFLLTLLWAGHETTVGAQGWFLCDLLSNPHALAEVRSEVDSVTVDGTVDMNAVRAMRFTGAAIRESGRMHPIAPIVARAATADVDIDGWSIPPGTLVITAPPVLHRRPQRFPAPDTYRPERFLGEGGAQAQKSLLDFGRGLHRCIGSHFATVEMTVLTAALLAQFDIELVSGGIDPVSHGGASWPESPLVTYRRRARVPALT